MEIILSEIRTRKQFPQHHQQGAVMLKCNIDTPIDFEGIDIYHAKNPAHFWLGKVAKRHLTLHHGFDLTRYETEEEWAEDIKKIMPAEGLMGVEMECTPSFFTANPALLAEGEDNYFTVIVKVTPTKAMTSFRNNLLKVFPHTTQFAEWAAHLSIATVSSAEARDELMSRLKTFKVKVGELFVGFNK